MKFEFELDDRTSLEMEFQSDDVTKECSFEIAI